MRHFTFQPSFTVRGRTNHGLRGLAGKPLHPPLTDIPIAAYVFAAAFDVLSIALHASHPVVGRELFVAGSWVLLGGLVVSVLAATTGAVDRAQSSVPGTQARRTINAHAITMLGVTAVVLIDVIVRYTADRAHGATSWLLVVLSAVAAVGVCAGATLGGSMVFDYGFNVETAGDHPAWHQSESDVFPGEPHV